MDEIIKLNAYPVRGILELLLKDKTTKSNIIWATDSFSSLGEKYSIGEEITTGTLTGFDPIMIQPRIKKALAEQRTRTRTHAEVFTPSWLCNKMNNYCDEEWFGRKNVFNTEDEKSWKTNYEKITFPEGKDWRKYVDSKRLEITCGEAPYIVSRYDASTGEMIDIKDRIGLLDRKLRIVCENAQDEAEWLEWATRAFQSVYGYEYQGDSLIICRINLLMTYADYLSYRLKRQATEKELKAIANIITWNFWQMDGLKAETVAPKIEAEEQLSFFGEEVSAETLPCRIYNWRADRSLTFNLCGRNNKMKFDYVIGNPPYQQESVGANANDTPIYHYFYEEAFKVSQTVELISPARFLFNAGGTPKEWNEKMLNDEHFKVLFHEQDSSKVFSNTDIKGGIAITYRNTAQKYEPIGMFTAFPELNSIKSKVDKISKNSLSEIISNRGMYRYSDKAYEEQPEEMKKTADRRIAPSSFERMPSLFTEEKPNDEHEYIQIYGNIKNIRVYRWFRKDYLSSVDNLYKYKVMVPKANGSGAIGEVLSTPLIGTPLIGFTETYIAIGSTDSQSEAEAILKYVKTKFARTMLGILKVTQNNAKPTWKYVPLQDFTDGSDIDWSKSIAEIDRQLYSKYGLSAEEIEFIEAKVKEME